MLNAIDNDTERGVNHAAIRVVPHGAANEKSAITITAVKEVTVVVIRIGADGLDDRVPGLMDREIVEWRDHGASPCVAYNCLWPEATTAA
ncbi:unannotated protein [freshwater metagenome]|uniref:Unannotated protein n=1 Tax=freshwater metagenome TaxID=449393 RepID=A0A6J6Y685_9ZZZZ